MARTLMAAVQIEGNEEILQLYRRYNQLEFFDGSDYVNKGEYSRMILGFK